MPTPLSTLCFLVLLDIGATHCYICAHLAESLGRPHIGAQDLPAPMLAHLGQNNELRDALSVALMDMNVDGHLILNQTEQVGPGAWGSSIATPLWSHRT